MNAKYVGDTLEHGRLKIGTAAEYRIPDGKDGGRADANELVVGWRPDPGIIDDDQADILFKKFGRDKIEGVKFVFEQDAAMKFVMSAYIYSMVWAITDNLRRRMALDFYADACIEISDPASFARAISSHPKLAGRNFGMDHVRYVAENVSKEIKGEDSPYEKLHRFGWQRETRIIWDANDSDEALIIDVPAVRPLLKRLF
jgi:hypothetical protein